jgi:hypothetical protein
MSARGTSSTASDDSGPRVERSGQDADSHGLARLEHIERRIMLVRQAGEAALPWARVALMLMAPISVITGLPHDAIALAREAIRSP